MNRGYSLVAVCLSFGLCVCISGCISVHASLNSSSRLFLLFSVTPHISLRTSLALSRLSICRRVPHFPPVSTSRVVSLFLCFGLAPDCWAQAIRLRVHPLYLMIPGTVGCSYAFMLPVSTPPNSIAFASGHLLVKDMVSAGVFQQRPQGVGGPGAGKEPGQDSRSPLAPIPEQVILSGTRIDTSSKHSGMIA